MVEIFLVHDGEVFEMLVSGSVVSPSSGRSLADALQYLPDGARVVIDLGGVTAMDEHTARAIRDALADRAVAGVTVALACGDDGLHNLLEAAGVADLGPLHDRADAARRSLLAVDLA